MYLWRRRFIGQMQLLDHTHYIDSEATTSTAKRFAKARNPTLGSEVVVAQHRSLIDNRRIVQRIQQGKMVHIDPVSPLALPGARLFVGPFW